MVGSRRDRDVRRVPPGPGPGPGPPSTKVHHDPSPWLRAGESGRRFPLWRLLQHWLRLGSGLDLSAVETRNPTLFAFFCQAQRETLPGHQSDIDCDHVHPSISSHCIYRVQSGTLIAIQDAGGARRVGSVPTTISSARLDSRERHTARTYHHPNTHVNHIAQARYMYCHVRDAEPPAPRVGTLRAQAKGL